MTALLLLDSGKGGKKLHKEKDFYFRLPHKVKGLCDSRKEKETKRRGGADFGGGENGSARGKTDNSTLGGVCTTH